MLVISICLTIVASSIIDTLDDPSTSYIEEVFQDLPDILFTDGTLYEAFLKDPSLIPLMSETQFDLFQANLENCSLIDFNVLTMMPQTLVQRMTPECFNHLNLDQSLLTKNYFTSFVFKQIEPEMIKNADFEKVPVDMLSVDQRKHFTHSSDFCSLENGYDSSKESYCQRVGVGCVRRVLAENNFNYDFECVFQFNTNTARDVVKHFEQNGQSEEWKEFLLSKCHEPNLVCYQHFAKMKKDTLISLDLDSFKKIHIANLQPFKLSPEQKSAYNDRVSQLTPDEVSKFEDYAMHMNLILYPEFQHLSSETLQGLDSHVFARCGLAALYGFDRFDEIPLHGLLAGEKFFWKLLLHQDFVEGLTTAQISFMVNRKDLSQRITMDVFKKLETLEYVTAVGMHNMFIQSQLSLKDFNAELDSFDASIIESLPSNILEEMRHWE